MRKEEKAALAEALGASRVVEVRHKHIGGPLDMLALREEVNDRLQSSGGRPTDPSWTVSRQVPFKEESWSRLQDIASKVGESGRKVGAAQVAALLLESSLEEMEDAAWLEALDESRSLPLLAEPKAADAAGVTYNQFDFWVERGWLVPAGRRGRQRSFGADEAIRAKWLRSIAGAGLELDAVADDVRHGDLSARYLIVVTDAMTVRTAASRAQLYRVLEGPGTHLVIDQLPERRKLLGLPPIPDDENVDGPIQQAV